ncbi:hypothetical protein MHU86_8752 [Fragilaria crotonensis]|nr:hypothetical protein MHU86_8752 [Fragilaria crotonensis]
MSGVTELIFGPRSPLSTMLTSWVHFLTRTGGTTVAHLRQLSAVDASAPSRLGWFIERRIQQFLVACASCDHVDLVDPRLFDFEQARQQLVDGMFQFPICPYLRSKLGGDDSQVTGTTTSSGRTSGAPVRPGYADDVVTNPLGRLVKITSKDTWQTFVDHAGEAPIPNLCCRYHLNGRCVKSCFHANTHVALTDEQKNGLTTWVAKCRSRMRSQPDDGDKPKKQKVGNRDHYSLSTSSTPHLVIDQQPTPGPQSPSTISATNSPLLSARLNDSRCQPQAAGLPTSSRTAIVASYRRPTPPSTPLRVVSPAARSPAAVMHASRTAGHVVMAPAVFQRPSSTDAPHPSAASRYALPLTGRQTATATDTGAPISPAAPHTSGKYMVASPVPFPRPRSIDTVFPPLPTPHLPALLASILAHRSPPTHPTDFRFEWTPAATAHNLGILRRFQFDWCAALAAQPFSTLTPGSEFRPADVLAPLLSRHPLWPRFRERITAGADFPLLPITDTDRRTDVVAALARGNHKSARGHEAKLLDMLRDEVRRGWQLPLPREAALELPNCEVAPLGITEQHTIDEDGNRVPKLRLTHDQSFNMTRGAKRSVNDRVDVSQLTPARFGRALSRLLHSVCFLRRRFPQERLLLTKVDCKSAYRRIHLQPNTAAKSCTCIAGVLLMALRMTFGGSPNPSQWSDVSEVVADLANDLVRREDWDETEWWAPQQELLSSDKAIDNDQGFVQLDDNFEPAFEMSVDVSLRDDSPRFDCYLDDSFGVGREHDRAKLEAAVPLALHLVGRPTGDNESFPRDDLLSTSKFLAEAKASERKIILGWVVNTRTFTVSLPTDKHRAWTNDLQQMRTQPGQRATSKDLEAMIGRLNHAAFVIPNSRPFLGRLYRAGERARDCGSVKLSQAQLDDLALWERFLDDAVRGLSINRLVCRWPTRIVRVDACPQGLGGYGLQSGIAWRLQLGPDLIGRGSLNALEFLAALIGIWVEHQLGPEMAIDDVLLSQGDSTSATGWMSKSSFGDECPILLAVARRLASYLADHELSHYSQWFPGKENSVADALSRDFNLNDEEIVSLVQKNFAEQVPPSFRIIPLPGAMITSVGELLRLQPKTQQLPTTPVPSASAAGKGWDGSPGFITECRPRRQASTVRSALDDVAQAYRAHKFVSPVHDSRGRLDAVLAAQLKSYALEDPEPKRPQAIPAAVVAVVARAGATEIQRAVGQLVVGAFFFAMRSCEYSEVNGNRRTRILRLADLDFRKDGRSVDLAEAQRLREADTVSVTYRNQKNGDRGVTVTQHRTGGDEHSTLCPVRAFAGLATRVSQYELDEHTEWALAGDRPINLVITAGEKAALISSNQILNHLRAGALLYGEERLGFEIRSIGTHSLRSGAATAMFIAGVPAETIQLIGRWKSQAFLGYIRIQVQQLTRGVASGMIENPSFFTIGKRKRTSGEDGRAKRQKRERDPGL